MLITCYDPRQWRASGIFTTSPATKHIKTGAGRYSRYVYCTVKSIEQED